MRISKFNLRNAFETDTSGADQFAAEIEVRGSLSQLQALLAHLSGPPATDLVLPAPPPIGTPPPALVPFVPAAAPAAAPPVAPPAPEPPARRRSAKAAAPPPETSPRQQELPVPANGPAAGQTWWTAPPTGTDSVSPPAAAAPEAPAVAPREPPEPAARPVEETPKVDRIDRDGLVLVTWREGPTHHAQVESEDPSLNGLEHPGADREDAINAVLGKVQAVRDQRAAAAVERVRPVVVPNASPVVLPDPLPLALTGATSFYQVVQWLIAPDGAALDLDDTHGMVAVVEALRPHMVLIQRQSGPVEPRIVRAIERIKLDRFEQAN